jgi:hypothetical protein
MENNMDDNIIYQCVNGEFVPLTPEETEEYRAQLEDWAAADGSRTATHIRQKRDALLRDSDVALLRTLEDNGDTAAVRSYRQSLRDITKQPTFPQDVVWPKFATLT